jgi:hypothetical protein
VFRLAATAATAAISWLEPEGQVAVWVESGTIDSPLAIGHGSEQQGRFGRCQLIVFINLLFFLFLLN